MAEIKTSPHPMYTTFICSVKQLESAPKSIKEFLPSTLFTDSYSQVVPVEHVGAFEDDGQPPAPIITYLICKAALTLGP